MIKEIIHHLILSGLTGGQMIIAQSSGHPHTGSNAGHRRDHLLDRRARPALRERLADPGRDRRTHSAADRPGGTFIPGRQRPDTTQARMQEHILQREPLTGHIPDYLRHT